MIRCSRPSNTQILVLCSILFTKGQSRSRGGSRNFLLGGPTDFGPERHVFLFCFVCLFVCFFCGKVLLTATAACFSKACERRSPLAREMLLCEQRRKTHWEYPKPLHFLISLELILGDLGAALYLPD